ncbi:cytoplasmic glycerophosphodiester phosphodiesterase [Acholeplasma oculi]|uniref:Glycerophosphoryl diester phosphodiesterase n=1 Tax=Acholeplasma oculi TaxID=35623 RepID=A0A061AC82_9MOLU|nr:glycerophosphodiester phosphodiesterase family protein [Acholeplasma oculi]CDR31485.1 Glycerophosphoryl diester phosphodiesterase [Acholeplasma oculi]SKC49290.1 glycerophosphoryl diester phosphodiesterase [Acholeplasma oculi]SUT92215.1 cytoplasmic glycerophosphodiester phosphodiesterase [Acholeplasma oculi]
MKFIWRFLKITLIVILSIVVTISIFNFSPWTFSNVEGTNLFRKDGKYPLIIPHGGAKDLAPENTIYAYDMLVQEFQADVLEIDLALTKDNILISHHDLELEMSDDSYLNDELIRLYTYQEIITEYETDDYYLARNFMYPADYDYDPLKGIEPFKNETDEQIMSKMIPAKLEDIFMNVGSDVLYILEIKDSPSSQGYDENIHDFELAAQTLIDLVELYELEANVVLASFSDDVTTYFKENAPDLYINAATSEVTMFSIFSAFHIDFFWGVKSEVLILPIPESMSITGGTANLLSMLPGFIRDSIAIKDDQGVFRANLMHQQIINDAHRKNMAVLYWTVNDKETMKLLIQNGADGIITDRPDYLIQVIQELEQNT